MLSLFIYLAAGVAVGLCSGLLGIGGGLIVVPVLLTVLVAQGYAMDVAMPVAVASSLATIIATGLSSAQAHWRLGNIVGSVLPWLLLGLMSGALVGAQLAVAIPGRTLQIIFGIFLLLLSARMISSGRVPEGRQVPPPPVVTGVGGVIGTLSGLLGIGGGTMTVPFMAWTGAEMRRAVGTSAVGNVAIALAGSVGFIVAGTGQDQLPAWSTGYVYWPAVAGIAVASVLTAPLGARLASRLPARWLRRGFAAFLLLVGVRMLLG